MGARIFLPWLPGNAGSGLHAGGAAGFVCGCQAVGHVRCKPWWHCCLFVLPARCPPAAVCRGAVLTIHCRPMAHHPQTGAPGTLYRRRHQLHHTDMTPPCDGVELESENFVPTRLTQLSDDYKPTLSFLVPVIELIEIAELYFVIAAIKVVLRELKWTFLSSFLQTILNKLSHLLPNKKRER